MRLPSDVAESADRRVQLWFGPHVLRTYRAAPSAAQEYAQAIGSRFPGVRVTVDDQAGQGLAPLPCEQLWILTP